MFARSKKAGKYEYLKIVENYRENKKPKQRVIVTLGRMDKLQDKGQVEALISSLSRFSTKSMLVLTGQSDLQANCKTIGPSLIFERIWKEIGTASIINSLIHQ